MLIVPLKQRLQSHGPGAVRAWTGALLEGRRLRSDGDASWFFHGTSLSRARSILDEGFRCPSGIIPAERNHVYWGPLAMAASFADKKAMLDRPALLAAPLSAILASGTALPMTCEDRQMDDGADEDELPDWRASVAESGAFRVRGGAHVAGIRLLGWNAPGTIVNP